MRPPAIPRATYRLQLNAEFTLADVEALVPYLDDLGVSHLYLSPITTARPGSTHGYDVVDHNCLNPELGDEAALERLAETLAGRGMGILLDFVPNHMGVGSDNAWWRDVLEWGEASPFAAHFDINWRPLRRSLRGKVLLPVLGDNYGTVLERGELTLRFLRTEGTFDLCYYHNRFPLAPRHYLRLLRPALAELPAHEELSRLVDLAWAAARPASGPRAVAERRRRAEDLKRGLAVLAASDGDAAAAIERAAAALAGRPGDPASFDRLHRLLEQQFYRMSFWRVAGEEINFRRFFDINDLAGLRMEHAELFETTHRWVFRLLREEKIHGLRIDHIDGLYNPAQYCQRLQRRAGELLDRDGPQPLYLLVEKILAPHERLRRDWPVAGTTGYEFMNLLGGLFVDGASAEMMEGIYSAFVGAAVDFEAEVYEAKMLIMNQAMASELNMLAEALGGIAESHWRSRDFTLNGLRQVLKQVVACLPIYRCYFTARRMPEQDKRYLDWAFAAARARGGEASVYDFVRGVLDTTLARGRNPAYGRQRIFHFAQRFQQYTGPVMAKGFEDTALYRYNRLIALNEVGGDPRRYGLSVSAFHQANLARSRQYPHALLATATHDSKRGEDVRLRIAVLSELTEEWRRLIARWERMNQFLKREVGGRPAPDRNDEYFLYQTLLGAWPGGTAAEDDFADRLAEALVKGLREAKRISSWAAPDLAYEEGVVEFARRLLDVDRRNPFLDDFLPFQARVARIGMLGGLSQTLLKLTVPGVPDIYQGCELWQLALVDPDNRRPVDYALRRRLLDEVATAPVATLAERWGDGAAKLFVVWKALRLRRRLPELFERGSYRPLAVRGELARHLCAFARTLDGVTVVVVVPVLIGRLWDGRSPVPPLGRVWRGTQVELPKALAGQRFVEIFSGRAVAPSARRSGGTFAAATLLETFPVALLAPVEAAGD